MKRRNPGFSILEVMIALAIFVLAATLLGSAYLNVLNGYEAANNLLQRNEDVRFARESMLAEPDPDVVQKGGDFEGTNNRRVRWTADLQPTETTDVIEVTFTCEITAPDLKKPEKVVEVFRVLRPTWTKPIDRDKLRAENKDRITKIITSQGPPRS